MHITSKGLSIILPYTVHKDKYKDKNTRSRHKSINWNHNDTAKTKELCYRTIVRSLIEYATVICDLLKEANIRKLEIVRR